MKRFSLSIVVALLTFCAGVVVAVVWMTRNTPTLSNATQSSGQCLPLSTQSLASLKIGEEGYFPQTAFYRDQHKDDLVRKAFAKYLVQMNEPSLVNTRTSDNQGTYRFTWLRSFHSKVVVRLWIDAGVRMLTVKELSREHDNQVGRLSLDQTRALNEDEWAEFTRLFNEACVWTLPSTRGDAFATDGAWWVFEANSEGYYQVVARQAPESSYRDLGLYMLKLSRLGLDAAKGEIY
jgi:hypothetical protein